MKTNQNQFVIAVIAASTLMIKDHNKSKRSGRSLAWEYPSPIPGLLLLNISREFHLAKSLKFINVIDMLKLNDSYHS